MCNPYAIAAMVAGTAIQANAQSKRQAAMENASEDAQNAEMMRQQGLSKERQAALDPAMGNATRATQDAALADAAAKRQAAYSESTTLPGDPGTADYQAPSGGAQGQPKVVQEEASKQRDKANADVRSMGEARARLQSYGDVGLGNQILNQNTGGQLNMLGGFSRMSSALLPGEIQNAMAKHAGDNKTQELLGTALQMYGAGGAPGLASGAAGAGAYGAAMGGSANAGASIGGYSGNLAGFAPSAGVAGEAAADAAAPGLMGGLFSNAQGYFLPAAQQSRYGTAAKGVGSLLARR